MPAQPLVPGAVQAEELRRAVPVQTPVAHALRAAFALAAASGIACAHDARHKTHASVDSVAWIDEPLLGSNPDLEIDRLAALAEKGVHGRLVRLDRLLDLLDAARFSGNEDARETFWTAVGGHPTGVGIGATRDAFQRLLEEGLALEETRELGEEASAFVADMLMMLSTDLELPGSAEDLSVQGLALRTLLERGHERIVDNARWRMYDHVRGVLAGATEAPPERRLEVAVHALYSRLDDIQPWLEDTAPHARPPWPTSVELLALLDDQREALAGAPRWTRVVQHRRADDVLLRDTVLATLPAARDHSWPAPTLTQGTGRQESLAPVLLALRDGLVVDAGRPQERRLDKDTRVDLVRDRIRAVTAQDGRGVLLLAADPLVPSPLLRTVLQAAAAAEVNRLELVARESVLVPSSEPREVVVALPIEIASSTDLGPRARAIHEARVALHVSGRGVRARIDRQVVAGLAGSEAELDALLTKLDAAYPRELVVAVILDEDLVYEQLFSTVRAAIGGPRRRFEAIGWLSDAAPSGGTAEGAGARVLERRVALAGGTFQIEQPYPLVADDQRRLEAFAQDLVVCLPELERPIESKRGLKIGLTFADGRLAAVEPAGPKDRRAAIRECVNERAFDMRLHEHRDRVRVDVLLTPP